MKFKYEFSKRSASDYKVPIIEVLIKNKENTISLTYRAMLDSGAFTNVVHEDLADLLGIDLRKIKQEVTFHGIGNTPKGLTGKMCIVELTVFQKGKRHSFDTPIIFSNDMAPDSIPVLGRQGFFDQFKEISFQFPHNRFHLLV